MPMYVQIFRCEYDCSNGGISSDAKELCLLNVLPASGFKSRAGIPAALLVKGNAPGCVKIVPADENGEEVKAWCMFGGNFAYSSDSRFHRAVEQIIGAKSYGAVPIHDRIED